MRSFDDLDFPITSQINTRTHMLPILGIEEEDKMGPSHVMAGRPSRARQGLDQRGVAKPR